MSKLNDWLVAKGLKKPEEVIPNHVRELLDLTIQMRVGHYTKFDIQNYLVVTEAQMEWLWSNSLLFDSEVEDERRRRLERERFGGTGCLTGVAGKGESLPHRGRHPQRSADAEREGPHGNWGLNRWRTLLVDSSAHIHVSHSRSLFPVRDLALYLTNVFEELEKKRDVEAERLVRRKRD